MMSKFEQIIRENPTIDRNKTGLIIKNITSAIVFIYSSWSPTIRQLMVLVDTTKDIPKLPLFVFDIDTPEYMVFASKNSIKSHGYGETFWIKNGNVIANLANYTEEDMQKLIFNNQLLR